VLQIQKELEEKGIRVEIDARNEKIGYRIREAQLQKIPYMLVVGEREAQEKTVSVRSRKDGDLGVQTMDQLIQRINEEVTSRA
jgi:threonyl-tRNA synthetase